MRSRIASFALALLASLSLSLSLSLSIAGAGCTPTPPATTKMPPADILEVSDLVVAAQKKADAFIAARDRGLLLAARGLTPRPDAPPCPEAIPRPAPLGDSDLDLKGEAAVAHEAARWRMNVVPDWTVAGSPPPEPLKSMEKIENDVARAGPRHDQFDRQSSMVRRILADGVYSSTWTRESLIKLARELGSDEYWGWELDVVTKIKSAPTEDGSGTFSGGILFGTAYLWSFPKGRVLCVADVKATNQDRIKLSIDPNDKTPHQHQRLNDDLKNEAYRAAISALVAVPSP
ncbi:MAG: hypothetical protein ABJE95_27300 [Byssovorax sp.]